MLLTSSPGAIVAVPDPVLYSLVPTENGALAASFIRFCHVVADRSDIHRLYYGTRPEGSGLLGYEIRPSFTSANDVSVCSRA